MSIFRRETSKAWLRSFTAIFPLLLIGIVWAFHRYVAALPITILLCIGTLVTTVVCIRLFIHADRMLVEIFDDRIDWDCFIITPRKASIPIEMISEVIIYKRSRQQVSPSNLLLKLSDGRTLAIPNPTGSYRPILNAINQARPDIPKSTRFGISPEQQKIFWGMVTGKRTINSF